MRPRVKGRHTVKNSITVDVVTDAAVKAYAQREGLPFSRAFCALATSAALTDSGLKEVIRDVVAEVVYEQVAIVGDTPEMREAVAQEVLGPFNKAYMGLGMAAK